MKNIIFIAAFLLLCFSVTAQNDSILFCENGNKTVRLEFENNAQYLELNKPSKLKIYVENIELKESSIVGRGIRPLSNIRKDDFFLCSVTVDEEGIENGNYTITFAYPAAKGNELEVCKFLIPVRQ